jgi:alanine dehydrogenase
VIVGVPSEIKPDEYRVAITPAGVRELSTRGHEVLVQAGAGEGSAMADEQFQAQGARIVPNAEAVFAQAELVLKVKEPQPSEVRMLRAGQTLLAYLHLAAEPELALGLQESGATCIAYETVEDADGRLPLLAPMSEVAGKIATQAGAFMLEKPLGGRGILLGGVPGVAAATVVVIGGGVVGMNAAFIAIGMQADVFVFDRSVDRLRELEVAFGGRASTVYSSTLAIEEMLPTADLVIGAVLVRGGRAPHMITREQLKLMKKHAVLVDVSIDQGGCFETSHPTTHSDPTFEVEGITHYCVTNMPGAVPITSTYALTNSTLPYTIELADRGVEQALARDSGLRLGLNVARGEITHPAVAAALGIVAVPPAATPTAPPDGTSTVPSAATPTAPPDGTSTVPSAATPAASPDGTPRRTPSASPRTP